MIKIIILFLILIIVLILQKYVIEKFECLFIPWGTSLNNCIDICGSSYKKKYWNTIDDSCQLNKCTEICSRCNNKNRCQWINKYGEKKLRLSGSYNSEIEPINNTLELYNIGQTSVERGMDKINDGSILLKWKNIDNNKNNNKNMNTNNNMGNYMVHFYLYNKDGKDLDSVKDIKIINTTANYIVFNKNVTLEQEKYEYKDSSNKSYYIDLNANYTFIVYELNSGGILGKSNSLNITTPSIFY